MQMQNNSVIEINGTEKKGLTLNRVRVEETRIDRQQIPSTQYPSGIIVGD